MFLNSSIGISEGVRATLFLRDCRKRNIIHRGGVDIKWNGPVHVFVIYHRAPCKRITFAAGLCMEFTDK